MLCSYFISKLYLKLTGFSFFFPFIIFGFLLIMIFQLNLDFCSLCFPWQLLIAVYLVVKSFLLVSSCAIKFLCGQYRKKRQKKTKQFQHQQ